MEIGFKKITIIGVGLIGGSIARTIKEKDKTIEITGIGRNKLNLEKAKELNIIDKYFLNAEGAIADADLIILATPVKTIPEIISKIEPHVKTGVIITDAGSSKAYIVNSIENLKSKKFLFVGSHPMAGSEKIGVVNSRSDLFINSVCFVTKTKQTDPYALNKIKNFWKVLGANIVEISPDEHDDIVALTSHLPHLIATSLVDLVKEQEDKNRNILTGIGNGFRDTTRIASSDPVMWRDIFISNKKCILKKINDLRLELFRIETLIQMEDTEELFHKFSESKKYRDNL